MRSSRGLWSGSTRCYVSTGRRIASAWADQLQHARTVEAIVSCAERCYVRTGRCKAGRVASVYDIA
eukprot:2419243-Rhodomonas_salina.1